MTTTYRVVVQVFRDYHSNGEELTEAMQGYTLVAGLPTHAEAAAIRDAAVEDYCVTESDAEAAARITQAQKERTYR